MKNFLRKLILFTKHREFDTSKIRTVKDLVAVMRVKQWTCSSSLWEELDKYLLPLGVKDK